jgi:hypothetical protein
VKPAYALLLACLLVGCSTLPKPEARARPQSISAVEQRELGETLRDAPRGLRELLAHEIEGRMTPGAGSAGTAAPVDADPRAILREILVSTRNPALLPDAQFLQFQQLVTHGKAADTRSFAAALTAYMADPEARCRQPLMTRYFDQRYRASAEFAPCEGRVPFFVPTRYEGVKIVWIDPKRVGAIHLMFAGKGRSVISGFGHVSLRLIVCPDAGANADTCDLNLGEHLVLGFGAHINDIEIDINRALHGEYKAYLFASRFMDTYQDYAIAEFRELYSVPLEMDAEQREQMVRELSEIHWRYQDDYEFFSKNCTSLLQRALRVLWPRFAQDRQMAKDYIRPDRFFERIRASSLIGSDTLRSLDVAEQRGNYFPSTEPYYQEALDTLNSAMSNAPFHSIERYLETNPVNRRAAMLADEGFDIRLAHDQRLLDAQLLLEELAVLRGERQFMVTAAHYFHRNFSGKLDTIRAQLDPAQMQAFDQCLVEPMAWIAKPIQRWDGIPDLRQIPAPPLFSDACQTPEAQASVTEVLRFVIAADSKDGAAVIGLSRYWANSIDNVRFFKSHFGESSAGAY